MARSADYRVRVVPSQGEADVSVFVVNGQVVDLTGGVPGEVVTLQPDGTLALDPSGGGVAVTVEDEGVALGVFTSIDFVGAGVTASLVGAAATVTIPGGGGNLFIQDTPPVTALTSYQWWETAAGELVTMWVLVP